jgi:1-acyl-sn-glycerol-3-phosphate acyltransferase
MRSALRAVIEALFRVLFTYDCLGEEKLPATGGAIVASNHPSYLDPVLLSLQVERPIRFMAWDALFRVPLLGSLMRAFGAFPVDIRKGRGASAFGRARSLVEQGELVGIFPEGRRSRSGWMEPSLREGAARLSLETGAPLVPATITGAYRAWPQHRSLPGLARIQVRFHDPIDPGALRGQPADVAIETLLAELRRRVERTLLPGVKADLRMALLWRSPAPWPRLYESTLPLALALLVFWKTRSLLSVAPAYAYIGYLLLDHFAIPQGHLTKWLRNASPMLFVLGYGPAALAALGLPSVTAGSALAALLLGAGFAYLYEHASVALGFVRGFVFTSALALGAQQLAPNGLGPHLALPLFAAAYAWDNRSVFWRYSVPVLLLYVAFVWRELGGSLALVPHATAGLLGWLVSRLFPLGRSAPIEEEEPEQPTHLSLGL